MSAFSNRLDHAWRMIARPFSRSDDLTVAVLLLPSLALLAFVIAYPVVEAIWISFTNGSLIRGGRFIGLQNYVELLGSASFWHSLQFSLIFAFSNVVGCYLLGLSLALLLLREFPGKGILKVLCLMPWIVPSLVAVVSWRWMAKDENAFFNQIITFFGGDPIFFLSDSNWAIAMVIAIKIWRSFPFMLLSLLAGLQTIDRTLYEAAEIDGAARWQAFWHVTMPSIGGVSVMLCLLMTIWTVNDFDTPWLLAQGGLANATENLVVLAYRYTFARNNVGMGAAVSLTTLVIMMSAFAALRYIGKRAAQ